MTSGMFKLPCNAAATVDVLSGDPSALLLNQQQDRICDVVNLTQAVGSASLIYHALNSLEALRVFSSKLMKLVSCHRSRGDSVDSDAMRATELKSLSSNYRT